MAEANPPPRARRVVLVAAGIGVALVAAAGVTRVLRPRDSMRADAVRAANEIWARGDEAALRRMFRAELDRIPESDGPARARVFIRFGVIDDNPDGQAALFNQACAADPTVCDIDRLKQAAKREVEARLVPPGNHLPLYFDGHPRITTGSTSGK